MFLIEPFIWMFSVKNFKHHFAYLLLVAAVCWLLTYLIYFFYRGYFLTNSILLNIVVIIACVALFLTPFLCLTGYYWCLTDNVIGRTQEAKLNSVYNGKHADLKNVITLPDWDIPRFIWRGIASIFATLIMYIPFTLIMILIVFNLSLLAVMWSLDTQQVTIITFIFVILFTLLIPGLLWNYARRDSVMAVLNIPVAFYLMDCYPGKYFLNSFLIVVFSIVRSLIMRAVVFALGFGTTLTALYTMSSAQLATLPGTDLVPIFIILLILGYVIDAYWIFVNAYLLGTIAPPSEY